MSTFHFIIFHSIIRFISYFLPHFILIFNFVVIVVFFHRLFQVINYMSCTRHCSTPNGHSKDALIDWYLLALDQSLVVFIIRFRRARIYPLLLVESPGVSCSVATSLDWSRLASIVCLSILVSLM